MQGAVSWKEATLFWWSQAWRVLIVVIFLTLLRILTSRFYTPKMIAVFDSVAIFLGIGIQIWAVRCAMSLWSKTIKEKNHETVKR